MREHAAGAAKGKRGEGYKEGGWKDKREQGIGKWGNTKENGGMIGRSQR